jgi:uncharacterized SAM-dependent methyltransferase
MNRELSAEFNRGNFVYHSFYNPSFGRMESWILSVKRQSVRIQSLQKAFEFEPWEGIHVENSYKYNLTDIHRLADTVGFAVKDEFIDSKGYFVDAMWQVVKDK